MSNSIVRTSNGTARFENYNRIYVGCTCAEGDFPPTQVQYQDFQFAPAKGTSGFLVFHSGTLGQNIYSFVAFNFESEKLVVRLDAVVVQHQFGTSPSLGIYMVRDGKTYVTKAPEPNLDYRLVDEISLLRCAEGRLTVAELDALSEVHVAKLAEESKVAELRYALDQANEKIAWLKRDYHDMKEDRELIARLHDEMQLRLEAYKLRERRMSQFLKQIHMTLLAIRLRWWCVLGKDLRLRLHSDIEALNKYVQ